MKLLLIILKKELKIMLRGKVFISLSAIIMLLSILALLAGFLNYRNQQKQIEYQQHKKRTEWLGQGDKHPHIAAHYGTFAFKPKTILSILDFGLDAYTGTSVYLEAHYQHEFMFRPAQDHTSMIRFGQLSMSMVLQVLLPLMIIFTGFSAFSKEKQRGTLKMIISQGVSLPKLIWGKIMSHFLMIIMVLTPAIILSCILTFYLSNQAVIQDLILRQFSFVLLYAVYLFIFTVITILISLWSVNGRTALLSLLAIWIIFTLILPKSTANLGENFTPLPSMREFKAAKEKDMITGVSGMDDRKTYYDKLIKENLTKYQVDSVDQLPFNYDGIKMQAGEEYADKVYDHHLQNLRSRFHDQNRVSSIVSLINPFLAIRNLSMMICGSDIYSAIDFENKAELYRRNMVKKMNQDMAQNSAYGEFFEYKATDQLWNKVKEFYYQLPLIQVTIKNYQLEFMSLIFWAFLCFLLIRITTKRFRYLYE